MFNYKILLFTVCLLCSYITNGQVLFNILHLQDVDSVNSTPWGYSIVDIENDTIKLNAIGASGSPGFIKSYLYNIYNDTSFQIINRLDGTSQRTSYYPIPGSFIRINDSIYVLGCTKISYTTTLAQDTICSGLIYFNKYGDTLFSKWYGMSEKFLLRGFQRIENNLFLLGVTKVIGDGTKAHIVRTSLGGDLIWEKTLTTFTTYYCNALSIASVSNNGYLVEGIMNSHDIGPIHISNVGLYRIDTNGNILWYKNIFNNANGGCYSVKEDGMGNFFLSGNIDTIVNLVDHNSNQFILKMDSNANINWIHIFNETPHILNNMWKFEIIGNGNLVFCGEQLETLGTTNHIGILGLMDSSGNVKWEHYYKQNDSSS